MDYALVVAVVATHQGMTNGCIGLPSEVHQL
jgi:hypothetical protein